MKKQTRGQRNIAWVESCCRIPEGKFVGSAVVLKFRFARSLESSLFAATRDPVEQAAAIVVR